MGYFTLPWGLAGALLAATYLRSVCVTASPSINVGLKAAFSSAPYLLELLYNPFLNYLILYMLI